MSAGCGSIATPSTLSEVLGGEGVSTHTVETVSTSLAPPHPLWDASGSFSYDARRSRRFSSESAFGMSVAPVAAIATAFFPSCHRTAFGARVLGAFSLAVKVTRRAPRRVKKMGPVGAGERPQFTSGPTRKTVTGRPARTLPTTEAAHHSRHSPS